MDSGTFAFLRDILRMILTVRLTDMYTEVSSKFISVVSTKFIYVNLGYR